MKPYYETGGVTLYHGDCREILPSLVFDAVITDPPYGLADKWQGGTWFTRGVYNNAVTWDTHAPQDAVNAILAFNVPTIIWGGNHFTLPTSRGWLVWDKTNAVPTMADVELAWTNIDKPAKRFAHACNGWARQHPTEKPIALIRWCYSHIANTDGIVCDPFAGSGTTLIVAKETNRRAIGIEIDERYCEIAARRLSQEVLAL